MASSTLQRVAAIAIFLGLSSIGFYTVLYHAAASGGNSFLIEPICPKPPLYTSSAQLHYTGLPRADMLLCKLVTLFHAGFQHSQYTTHFLAGFAPGVLAYLVEFSRDGGGTGPAKAMGVGIAYQLGSAAVVLPLAWLGLVLRSKSKSASAPRSLTRLQAEAAVSGVLLGSVLPSVLMVALQNERVTAAWQIFPVYIWIVQNLWLALRQRNASAQRSGYPVLRAGFIALGLLSFAQHLRVLSGAHSISWSAFVEWWPSFSVPTANVTLYTAAAHLLQWDSIIYYTTTLLASIFLGTQIGETLGFLLLAPVVSPGAVVALLWIRREARLPKLSDWDDTSRKKAVLISDERKMR